MFRNPLIAPANKGADRGRRRIKNVDAIILDDFPEAIRLRPVWRAFVHECGGAIRQRPVNDITVTGDPPDVGRAPKNIFVPDVEDILHG